MILTHNVSFIGGETVQKGTALSQAQAKELKASGSNYHEVKKVKVKTKAKK
jgi:hypothetical protein